METHLRTGITSMVPSLTVADMTTAKTIVGILTEAQPVFNETIDLLVSMCTRLQELDCIMEHFWSTPTSRKAFEELALMFADRLAFYVEHDEEQCTIQSPDFHVPIRRLPNVSLNYFLLVTWRSTTSIDFRKDCVRSLMQHEVVDSSP